MLRAASCANPCQCEKHAGEPCAALGPVVRKDVLRAVRLFRPALVAGDAVPAGLKNKTCFMSVVGHSFFEFVEEWACGRVGVRLCVRGGNAVAGRIREHVGGQGERDHGVYPSSCWGKVWGSVGEHVGEQVRAGSTGIVQWASREHTGEPCAALRPVLVAEAAPGGSWPCVHSRREVGQCRVRTETFRRRSLFL